MGAAAAATAVAAAGGAARRRRTQNAPPAKQPPPRAAVSSPLRPPPARPSRVRRRWRAPPKKGVAPVARLLPPGPRGRTKIVGRRPNRRAGRAPAPPSACQLWRFGGVAAGRGTRPGSGPPPPSPWSWGGTPLGAAKSDDNGRRVAVPGGGGGSRLGRVDCGVRLGGAPAQRVAHARRTLGATATARDWSPRRVDGQSRRPLPGGKRREVGRGRVRPSPGWSTRTGAQGKSRMLVCPPQTVGGSLTFGKRGRSAARLLSIPKQLAKSGVCQCVSDIKAILNHAPKMI